MSEEQPPAQRTLGSILKKKPKLSHQEGIRPSHGFQCCIAKEYYSEYANLVESLHISPRMMIQKKRLRANYTYGMTLNIRNNGLYPRLVQLSTDSPSDTFISIPELELHRYLETDQTLEVKIWIRSSARRDINRRRHIFVECFHPNIIFQVPIIVLGKLDTPTVSESIVFPSCVPGNKTYFELIVYNPSKDSVRLRCRNTNRGLEISTGNKELLPPQDYLKVLLAIEPKKLHVYKGFFNLKFGMLPPKPVMFTFTPKSMGVHMSLGSVTFPLTKFEREEVRLVTVCNEGPNEVVITGEFLKDALPLPPGESYDEGVGDGISGKLISDAVSMRSVLLYDFEDNSSIQEVLYHPGASQHFEFFLPSRVPGGTSADISLCFRPYYDPDHMFPCDMEPPYSQRTRATFCFADGDDCIESHIVVLSGKIAGVELEVHPKVIDFRKIYLGEEHCAQIKFLNVDSVPAKVVYVDSSKPELAGIRITPAEGFLLEPCTRGIFNLSFYSLEPARFSLMLRFKVKNGARYEVELKGTGQPVQLRTFPNLVEFGSIPIAVPQKRYMLLLNPLAVPITLQVKPTEDGQETPLVLNIRDSTEMLPITVRDPIRHLQQVHEELVSQAPERGEIILADNEPEVVSIRSVESTESVYSAEFEEEVMEPIPLMAAQLLSNLKKKKIFDKSESDRRIIQEALTGLLHTKYFSVFTKHNNYVFMDWNALPSDPREVYCDNEVIYLRPNTGRTITILVVPNKAGYYRRSLSVRICPAIPSAGIDSSDDQPIMKTLIKSEFLCSKLWFEYNCVVPDIEWSHQVDLTQRTIYAGEEYDFDMEFSNRSIVGAFLHYEVVPTDMTFRDGTWKFYIDSGAFVTAKCAVTFRSLGSTRLMGLVKVVGANRPYAFHVFANVLPTEIRVTPMSVHRRLQVYQEHKQHFYIDNYTPTHTMLSMRLKDVEFQYLTSRGGALASTGQSMYTTMVSMFTDPDIYQNTLYIDLQFDNMFMVPITFRVEGVPLYFEPNIREGFDAGLLYTDTREQFQDGVYTHRFPVRVINKGYRAYRILIIRLNSLGSGADTSSSPCATHALTARFDMEPKNLYLAPSSESELDILASSYVEGHATGDFLLQVVDQKYPTSKHIIRVSVEAEFVECQLLWSPKQVNFNYKRCDPLRERAYEEIPLLVNPCAVPIDKVTLQVSGPFRIKEFFEDTYEKELQISVAGCERKEIFVVLNRGAVKHLACRQIEGKINVMARSMQLKTLPLRVTVKVPEVVILQPELVLFDQGRQYESSINLINQGCAAAEFKWKRLWTKETYVGDEDDPEGIASDLLSEILRMLEYDFSCEDQPNMTKRYQECRCQFRRFLEGGDMVMEILDEVINELDLRHRPLLFQPKQQPDPDEDRDQSSTSLVRETIEDILNRLHIDSSEEWSEPSSEYCFSSRYIYFLEKRGTVQVLDSQPGDLQCKLHLPHIRRNLEMQAFFELAIVGGRSQFLTVTLLNLAQKIRFHKDSVYVGIKPWYESFEAVVRISNVTKYPLKLVLVEVKSKPPQTPQGPPPLEKRLVEGYTKLMTSDMMHLEPLETDQIRVKGILGFSESFRHTFGVMINNSDSSYFWVRGQGVMPMLEMSSPLPAVPMDALELEEEYRLLQRIYQYEIFRSITEVEEEVPAIVGEEEGQPEAIASAPSEDFTILSSTEEDMPSEDQARHDLQLFRMVHTYVMVNNNQELPHATVLRQLLLAERYLQRLRLNPKLYALHQQVYQSHLKLHKAPGYKQPSMVKHFTVQPIPCEQHGYILDLGSLARNSLRRFELKLHFFGPGKLIAAARTAVRIPGLFVDFNVAAPAQHAGKKFSFWSEKCKSLEYFKDKYRNMFERLMDAEQDPKLKHAHSFDLDRMVKHQRDLAPKDRRLIEEYYNSLNPSVYPDHKHHFTLAKIFSGSLSNYSGVDLTVVGFFKPEARFYEKSQLVEDYIYIDLHMGPTLPILLRGLIAS